MIVERLFKFTNWAIICIFYLLFSLTTYFTLTSPNIILGDNAITGAGTTYFTTGFIIVTVAILIGVSVYPKFRQRLEFIFIQHHSVTTGLLILLTLTWQLIFTFYVHPAIGFDVGAIHNALINPKTANIIGYFSQNNNNLPLLLVQHQLAVWLHNTSWLFFDLWTILIVDLSAILNTLSVKILDPSKVVPSIYVQSAWLLVFPMIIVPYTDTWVLPLVSLYFFCYCVAIHSQMSLLIRYLAVMGFGAAVIGAYYIKPSAIVIAIAIILVEILSELKPRKMTHTHIAHLFVATLLFLGVSSATFVVSKNVINQQTYIEIYPGREIPPIHFVGMGISGDGGYNAKDAYAMAVLPTKEARATYSKKVFLQRLKKRGFFGYLAFLIKKQNNDTADGTFAWIKEGHFINDKATPSGGGFGRTLRDFVYLYGKNLGDFRYIAQIVWIVIIVMIFLGWRQKQKIVQVLRLAIVGGCLYLLLFEGGRSRYLIQFLPAFLILASLSSSASWRQFKSFFTWINIKF